MAAEILNGKRLSRRIEKELAKKVAKLEKDTGITPFLTVVLVGDDPASQVYVRRKTKACERVGVREQTRRLPASTSEEELLRLIERLNADDSVHGILVQMPVPAHIDAQRIIEAIDYRKDVDGFHPYNVGLAATGAPLFEPCTPFGVLEMLNRTGHSPVGKHVVIVGRSNIVGKPLMNMLVQKTPRANATVTVCHTGTDDIGAFTRQADIVIAAAGKPAIITGAMLKPGAVVIDVGINAIDDPDAEKGYRLVGDVEFESAKEVAAAITPVPGGVGPMTCVMLARNTLRAAQLHAGVDLVGEEPSS